MFFSGEYLKCTGCSEVFQLPLDVHCVYTTGDVDLNRQSLDESNAFHRLLRRRAWCLQCDSFALVERLPSLQEFMNAAAMTRSQAEDKPYVDDELLELSLEEQKFLFERLSRRTAPAHCLSCGSTKWVPLDVDDRGLQPPLLHESCNSPLRWEGHIGSYVRRAGTLKVRAYSFDGDLLAEGMF